MSDVCLILEGTYPYITGGVSSCAHQMIKSTPQIEYSILYIGTKKEQNTEYKYEIPSNVTSIQEVYLFEPNFGTDPDPKELGIRPEHIDILENSILFKREGNLKDLYTIFFNKKTRSYNPEDLFFSKEIWNILERFYKTSFTAKNAPSFIDFFYNWRFSNLPIFKILQADIPTASIYHSLSTGYAGLCGAVAKISKNRPFLLTEHGIYTHERKIEISQSEWIYTNKNDFIAKQKLSYFKEWWLNKFYRLGELSYEYADRITTLFEGNKQTQIKLGAKEEIIDIIANGINYDQIREKVEEDKIYPRTKKFTIGLVGRVVPIKDIKTFIKSIAYVVKKLPDIEVLIMGPTKEDFDYYKDCVTLVDLLGLKDYIKFTDKVNLKYYYPSLDLIILSSISEGQPLVLLEGFCFNIPAIATDVGSCRELIEGAGPEDKAIGPAGYVVPFGRPDDLGKKIVALLDNDNRRAEFGNNAKKRLEKYYLEQYSIDKYVTMYNNFLLDDV